MSERPHRQVRWLQAAVDDLVAIVDRISDDAPDGAARFSEAIFSRTDQLARSPHLGSVCPYFRRARQLIHGNYIIYYTVHRREVVIRAVVHGARLFRSVWLRRDD